jgi:hypothetical protein
MRLPWLLALVPLAACGPDEAGGACKDNFVAGDLVVTEVFADFAPVAAGAGGADDGKEWFEIYNNADRAVSLKGVTVVHSKIDGSDAESHVIEDITIAPGQFFTLGNATQDLLPAYVDYGYSADLGQLSNTTGGTLALKCGDREIDSAIYDAVKSGRARQLTNQSPPDYTLNDDQVNWCDGRDTEFETNNFGTPGADNDCAPVVAGACSDGGTMREAVPPAVGDIVITEFMPKPDAVGATVGQWVEIKAMKDLDLNGVGIDRANDSAGADVINSPTCVHMAANSYALFARSGDMSMNGGLTTVGVFDFSINPTTNADVQITLGATVIDAVTWAVSTTGYSKQLDPDFTTASGNDDQATFCDGQTTYNMNGMGTDRGTPGADNAQCPAVAPPGMCLDNGTPRAIRKPAAGNLVITEVLANPATTMAGVDAAQEWFEIKNIGGTDFDVNELILKNSTSPTAPSYPIQTANCKNVAANGYLLFAHSTDMATTGLTGVDVTFTFSLGNSTGAVQFYDGTTLLDSFSWPTATYARDGQSRQLKVANTNTTDNDDASVVANFCDGQPGQTYGATANVGTPKAANVCP